MRKILWGTNPNSWDESDKNWTPRKAVTPRAAALNALVVARQYLGSLDRISRVVSLGVYLATAGDPVNMPEVADGASGLLRDVCGEDMMSARLVFGVASLPLGVPVELEVIFEVKTQCRIRGIGTNSQRSWGSSTRLFKVPSEGCAHND
jgi:hypothetical protein